MRTTRIDEVGEEPTGVTNRVTLLGAALGVAEVRDVTTSRGALLACVVTTVAVGLVNRTFCCLKPTKWSQQLMRFNK